MRVVWSPLALDRAAEAAKYIARDGPEVAAAWVDGLFDVVGKLLQFPRRGRVGSSSSLYVISAAGSQRPHWRASKSVPCRLTPVKLAGRQWR
ncbi:MAG: type II toxin-antitoxin system RelE/ParE family toxin [Gemmatimonadetes bacterium]|nr:type II toxin-antitoxin system RelE/ParE family toxin [Gemmatimonadota bacterium]MCH8254031.1 type II toxin-antitoxin system RelE/ParE family toxin [Gemmatimonadota bacterium]MCH8936366.1 type II toxin-antitoxin system RelE/ParE family toxin [Gemmatimonadota bacterium]